MAFWIRIQIKKNGTKEHSSMGKYRYVFIIAPFAIKLKVPNVFIQSTIFYNSAVVITFLKFQTG